MQATLIYNASAGGASNCSAHDIQDALKQAGYDVHYQPTKSEDDVAPALADAAGLVVVVGGDGTVRTVVTHYMKQREALMDNDNNSATSLDTSSSTSSDINLDTSQAAHSEPTTNNLPPAEPPRLSIVPLGTANNLSRALGIEGDIKSILAGLEQPQKCRFDVGYVAAPWGKDYFLEGFGCGIYADALAEYGPEQGKSFWRAADTFTDLIQNYQPQSVRAELDGQDISGELIMLSVLNTRSIGPRLDLAPRANPADGQLEVLRVCQNDQVSLLRYLTNMLSEELPKLPGVDVLHGKKLELEWQGCALHADAEVRPPTSFSFDSATRYLLKVGVLEGAVEFWLPQQAA